MWTTNEFAFGSYGDYSGIVFYGGPTNGFWLDSLSISDRFMYYLFGLVVRRCFAGKMERMPRLAQEWNECTGWDDGGIVEMNRADAEELLTAFSGITYEEFSGSECCESVEDCFRCVAAIQRFIRERLAAGSRVYIERG